MAAAETAPAETAAAETRDLTSPDGPLPEESRFSATGERLIFDNVPWKDWETAGVEAVQAALDKDNQVITRSRSDVLRFLHLAVSLRNDGVSGDSYTEEDVAKTVELLLQSRAWKEERQPTWTPKLRHAWKNMIFMMAGRDKKRRPVGVIRPTAEERDLWAGSYEDMNRCILALVDDQICSSFIPGVAEQAVFIVDLENVGLTDIPSLVPSLKVLIAELTDNYTGRGGTYYVVNAGWTLSAAVNTVMMFAQPETRNKVQVFRGTLSGYAEELFDLAALPKEFGGEAELGCLAEIPETQESGEKAA